MQFVLCLSPWNCSKPCYRGALIVQEHERRPWHNTLWCWTFLAWPWTFSGPVPLSVVFSKRCIYSKQSNIQCPSVFTSPTVRYTQHIRSVGTFFPQTLKGNWHINKSRQSDWYWYIDGGLDLSWLVLPCQSSFSFKAKIWWVRSSEGHSCCHF